MASQPVAFETGHQDMIHDAQLDYYGKRLATASSDKSIRVFDVAESGQQTLSATLLGHEGPVWQVAWAHPKFGPLLASAGYDGKIILWKEQAAGVWARLWEDDRHEASVNAVAFAPHTAGLILAAGSADGTVSLWTHQQDNTWTRELVRAHKGGVSAVSWAPALRTDGAGADTATPVLRLATGGCDNALRIWQLNPSTDTSTGASRWTDVSAFEQGQQPHADWIRDVAWAPALGLAAPLLATCSEDKTVRVWSEGHGGVWRVSKTWSLPQRAWRVSWSLTGDVLAIAQGDNTVSLWKQTPEGAWQAATTIAGAGAGAGAGAAAAATPAGAAPAATPVH